MSKLGDYIHVSWKNYRLYGTTKQGPSNFDPMIFAHHRTEVAREILKTKEINNIAKLEQQYNSGAKKLNSFISNVIAHKNDNKDFLTQLLSIISKNYKSISDYIIKGLKWDPHRECIIYDPEITTEALKADEVNAQKTMQNFQRQSGIHIDPLVTHLQSIKSKLSKLNESSLKIGLLATCQSYILSLQQAKGEDSLLADSIRVITRGKVQGGFLSIAEETKQGKKGFLNGFLADIQKLTAQSLSAIRIQNNIGAELAEIMGTVISENLNNLSRTALEEYFKSFVNSNKTTMGRAMTKAWTKKVNGNMTGAGIGSIELNLDNIDLGTLFDDKNSHRKAIQKYESKKTGEISYSIESFSDTVQQKADFIVTLKDNTQFGVSMKNYDMSDISAIETKVGTKIPNSIALQDSSLALYLGALELKHKPGNLGNHYLQILSQQRGYENGKYAAEIQRMRTQANQALSLYILWSAMTGRGQGRGFSNQFADILAIYDKADKFAAITGFRRIRLYSMRDILKDIMTMTQDSFNQVAIFTPRISQILLDNKRVGDKPDFALAKERISKLVIHAKSQNIAVSLSKIYLNTIAGISYK